MPSEASFYFFLGALTVVLSSLLFASEAWMHLDDVFGGDGQGGHLSVLRNGEPALLGSVIGGAALFSTDALARDGGADVAESLANTAAASSSSSGSTFNANGSVAVVVLGVASLPDGIITSAFKQRLLQGVRVALLTGSPWVVVPCGLEERRNAEDFLWGLQPPGEALFPDAVVTMMPPSLQGLARQIRDSMAFEASLKTWMQRGRIIERLSDALYADAPAADTTTTTTTSTAGEDMSSPRLLRYGSSEWILPGIVWGEVDRSRDTATVTEAMRAVELLVRRIFYVHLYDQKENIQRQPVGEPAWLQNDCFSVIVVGSMYNERYMRAIFLKEMRRVWRLPPPNGAAPRQPMREQQQFSPSVLTAECVRVLVTSADDAEPALFLPSPLFVRGPPSSQFSPRSSALARFLGVYAHTIHVNYQRWLACLHCSLVSHRALSFVNELFVLLGSLVTETLSLQDFTQTTLVRRRATDH
ncbi:hypothetical protein DQ04_02581060 [Trypanosoma grayi]|uniref:hypothetical protein n=1 Tax=Trypanosoma grayi TaxID=71804 RepID=UPI0004F4286C|nr:hypothetical protein DQ04_02581060 [Trypanosoma grayi]KEG11478.1 hypothetical protein DQ04_02581060 [Trypanosoma grayi]